MSYRRPEKVNQEKCGSACSFVDISEICGLNFCFRVQADACWAWRDCGTGAPTQSGEARFTAVPKSLPPI